MPLRSDEPLGLVDTDIAHRAPSRQIRSRGVEPVTLSDKDSCTKWGVQFVPGEREVVDSGCR
ncbi:Uncharacterised protein [Mycobacteroides abscessus subsp. massiliense]|nr:Uncharacterised protein [Mycobacteroides abscessus subsp. massiliense]